MPRLDGTFVDRIERARAFSQLTDVASKFDEVAKQAESAAQIRKAATCEAIGAGLPHDEIAVAAGVSTASVELMAWLEATPLG